MRFTVVDDEGTVSFVGPAHALKMLAAACSKHPSDHRALLSLAANYDPDLPPLLRQGALAEEEAARFVDDEARPFWVKDDLTRRKSLEPARAGLVLFNLNARRIIQVQNTYSELHRQGRGRIRRNGKPTRALYHYELPPDWTIVP